MMLALGLSYVSVLQDAEKFTRDAYSAASSDDLPGIGDAAFDFKLELMLLPMAAGFVYAFSRLILWGIGRYVGRWQARGHAPPS